MKKNVKALLALLLVVIMLLPNVSVLAATIVPYKKTGTVYTISGKSYYQAQTTDVYNGVAKETLFWLDGNNNVVTNSETLKKLGRIQLFSSGNMKNTIISSIKSNLSAAYSCRDAYISIVQLDKTCDISGKIIGKTVEIAANAGSGPVGWSSIAVDLLVDGALISVSDAATIAIVEMFKVYINNSVYFATEGLKYENKTITDYDDMMYLVECGAQCSANYQAAWSVGGEKITEIANMNKIQFFFSNAWKILQGVASGVFPGDTMAQLVTDAAVDGVLGFTDIVKSADAERVFKIKKEELYNSFGFMNLDSSSMINTSNKLASNNSSASSSGTSSNYSTGTYKPSEWDGLNIRSGASTSNSLVGAIAAGTSFVVTKVNGNWGYTTCNGKTGWVCLDYATFISSSTTTSSNTTTSSGTTSNYSTGTYKPSEWDGLNIRSGASTSNSLVGAIAAGTSFVVTKVNGNWGYTTCNGKTGWVCLDYATFISSSTTTTSSSTSSNGAFYDNSSSLTDLQKKVQSYAISQVGSSNYTPGYCQAFVWRVFYELGIVNASRCCAANAAASWMISSSKDIPVGAAVYFSANNIVCDDCGRHCGHVGVYVGDGYMVHNWGSSGILKEKVSKVDSYSGYSYIGYGWHGGKTLISGSISQSQPQSNIITRTEIENGLYSIFCGSYTLNAVTDSNAKNTVNGDNSDVTRPSKRFYVIKEGDSYVLMSQSSYNYGNKRVLNVWTDYSSQNGNEVTLYSNTSDASQRWNLEAYGNGYIIHPADNSSLSLTLSGTKIYVNNNSKSSSQIWMFEKVGSLTNDLSSAYSSSSSTSNQPTTTETAEKVSYISVKESRYYIKNGNYTISVTKDVSKNNGNTVRGEIATTSGDSGIEKKFFVTKVDDYYMFASASSKENGNTGTIDIVGNAVYEGNQVALWAKNSTMNQKWQFEKYGNGYIIHPASMDNLALTRDSSNNLYVRKSVKADNQIWNLYEDVETYTISYNANGGSNAPSVQTKIYSTDLVLSSQIPSRSGYTFKGWSTSSSGSVAYNAGNLYVNDKNETLYAVWEKNAKETYSVIYNANGGTNAPSSQTNVEGTSLNISSQTPVRTGYTFKGWSLSSNGNVIYYAGDMYSENKNIVLYAVWEKDVTEDSEEEQKNNSKDNDNIDDDDKDEKDKITDGNKNSLPVTLFYSVNGGTEPPSPVMARTGDAVIITSEIPSRSGYDFLGWAYSANAETPVLYGGDEITLNNTTTLFAVWNSNKKITVILTIGSKEASVNGETVYNDVAPLLVNDRTMLPARFVAEQLGADVSWNDDAECVTIVLGDTVIYIFIGQTTAYVDGSPYYLDSPAFLRNDRTYTPVRFICESLGANVDWIEETEQVVITSN